MTSVHWPANRTAVALVDRPMLWVSAATFFNLRVIAKSFFLPCQVRGRDLPWPSAYRPAVRKLHGNLALLAKNLCRLVGRPSAHTRACDTAATLLARGSCPAGL